MMADRELTDRRKLRGMLMALACGLTALSSQVSWAKENPADLNKRSSAAHGELIWKDEFQGETIDKEKWSAQTGNGFTLSNGTYIAGWGNDELQYYTELGKNSVQKNGEMHLIAKKESYQSFQYTSARIVTRGKFNFQYGRIDIRAKLPEGQGYWPALWLLPDNGPGVSEGAYGGWAASGEIDILENKGFQPNIISGALHYGGPWPNNVYTLKEYEFPKGQSATDFHTYSVIWEKDKIQWLVDEKVYGETTEWHSETQKGKKHPFPAPFNQPFYLIMNVAVGGKFGGNPNMSTQFPQAMVVDYVRVYRLPE